MFSTRRRFALLMVSLSSGGCMLIAPLDDPAADTEASSGGSHTTAGGGSGGNQTGGTGGDPTGGGGAGNASGGVAGGGTGGVATGGAGGGSGGSPSGGGGSGGSPSGGGGAGGSGGSTPPPNHYYTSGDWHGYVWTKIFPDAEMAAAAEPPREATTITPSELSGAPANGPYCVAGTVPQDPDYVSHATLGWNLNQGSGAAAELLTVTPALADPASLGIDVDVKNESTAPLRLQIEGPSGDPGDRWCVNLTGVTDRFRWGDFNTACWDGSGEPYVGTPLTSVMLVVNAKAGADVPFDFCMNAISEARLAPEEVTITHSGEGMRLEDTGGLQIGGNVHDFHDDYSTATLTVSDTACLAGQVAAAPTPGADGYWGAGLGFNLNQAGADAEPYDALVRGLRGFRVRLTGAVPAGTRVALQDAEQTGADGKSHFIEVPAAGGEYDLLLIGPIMQDARQRDWVQDGQDLDPRQLIGLEVNVPPGTSSAIDFDFCVEFSALK